MNSAGAPELSSRRNKARPGEALQARTHEIACLLIQGQTKPRMKQKAVFILKACGVNETQRKLRAML